MDQHHIAGVDAGDSVAVGDRNGCRANGSVDAARGKAVRVVQIAAAGHNAIPPIPKHIVRSHARPERRGVLAHAVQCPVILAVDLHRL